MPLRAPIESAHEIIRRAIREGVFTGSPEAVMLGLWQKLAVRGDPKVAKRYLFPKSRMEHRDLPRRVRKLLVMT